MSWQATAWAEKQKTGSPARKVLLLVLANYANEDGYCWPSQKTIAKGTEQSVDTIQRNAKRLEADGLLKIERKPRAGGRWPQLVYWLNMPTEPQNADAQEVPKGAHSGRAPLADRAAPVPITEPHQSRITEPHQSRSPGRIARGYEQSNNNIQRQPSLEPPPTPRSRSSLPREAKRSAEVGRRSSVQSLHNRIVEELGCGNTARGWLLFGALDGGDRKWLEDIARTGITPDHDVLEEYRAAAETRLGSQQ
jgi:hypothetical protein